MCPTIFIGLILGAVVGFLAYYHEDLQKACVGAFVFGFLGFSLAAVVWVVIGDFSEKLINYGHKKEIVSIENCNDSLSILDEIHYVGLVREEGKEQMSYFIYENFGDKELKSMKIFDSETILIEDVKEDQTPYYIEKYKHSDSSSNNGWYDWGIKYDHIHICYEIHIPKGGLSTEIHTINY